MTNYDFEKTFCHVCGKPNYCIIWEGDSYCEYCFGWKKEDATTKDKVRHIMINCGIEDLD